MLAQPFFYPAIILGLLALPLLFGWVPRNRYYGLRTTKTLETDAAWYPANRIASIGLIASALIYLAVAAIWPMSGVHDPRFLLWCGHLAAFVGSLVFALLVVKRRLEKR